MEAQRGIPFSGPSGRLLNVVLKHIGVNRDDVFLTNACLCRPQNNATPPPAAVRACNGRLVDELQEAGAGDIMALGNTAAQALLDTRTGITGLRVGSGYTSSKVPGSRIIPTFHPAAALRNADSFPFIVRDFEKLKSNVEVSWKEPSWRATDGPDDALAVIAALHKVDAPFVVDIETGIEKDDAFDHPTEYDILCIGIAYGPDKVVVLDGPSLGEERVQQALVELLRCKHLVFQNGKYDQSGLWRWTKGETVTWFDTMLAHYCLDERPGTHSLDFLGQEFLGAPNWKHVMVPYKGNYANAPRDVLYKYCAYDCAVEYQMYILLEERLEKFGLRPLHDFLCQAADQLMYLEMNGFPIDIDYLNQLLVDYLEITDKLEKELHEIAGGYINPRSPAQIKEWFLSKNVRVDSTDENTCELLKRKVPADGQVRQFIDKLLEYRGEQKLYSTYIKGTAKRLHRGRVYPTYLLHGTVTGRLSCRNPNLQNIPRGSVIRKLFVPSGPERVLIQADYSQAELRVLCCLAQDDYLRDIFLDPERDIHGEFAEKLYGPGWTKEQRVRTKAYVFGLSYGREEYSIAMEYNIPVAEAKRGMELFFKAIPDVVAFQTEVKKRVLRNEDLVTPFGRHRRFWLITDDNRKDVLKEALAFLPQSTASDICLSASTRLRPLLRGKAFLRNIIHDAIIADAHKDDAEEVMAVMSQVMQEEGDKVFGGYVPFLVDTKVGASWGDFD
jgi:DNA polymerase-1